MNIFINFLKILNIKVKKEWKMCIMYQKNVREAEQEAGEEPSVGVYARPPGGLFVYYTLK